MLEAESGVQPGHSDEAGYGICGLVVLVSSQSSFSGAICGLPSHLTSFAPTHFTSLMSQPLQQNIQLISLLFESARDSFIGLVQRILTDIHVPFKIII